MRTIAVAMQKGGVGKTTVAVNLAMTLCDRGARQVCLIDMDLAFGDVAITMQLFPSHSIEHAIGAEDTLDYGSLDGLLTRHESGLMVLAAPSLPDAHDRVTPTLVSRMIRTLKEKFDFVVIDTAPAFDDGRSVASPRANTLAKSRLCSVCLCVGSQPPPSPIWLRVMASAPPWRKRCDHQGRCASLGSCYTSRIPNGCSADDCDGGDKFQ